MTYEKQMVWLGNIMPTKTRENPDQGRVYSPYGIAPTLNTCSGGGRQPHIIVIDKAKENKNAR